MADPELLESVLKLISICKREYGEDILPRTWPHFLSSQYFEHEAEKKLTETFIFYICYVFGIKKGEQVSSNRAAFDYIRGFRAFLERSPSTPEVIVYMMLTARLIQYKQDEQKLQEPENKASNAIEWMKSQNLFKP